MCKRTKLNNCNHNIIYRCIYNRGSTGEQRGQASRRFSVFLLILLLKALRHKLYLCIVVVLLLLPPVGSAAIVLLARIEGIHNNLFGALDLGATEGTPLWSKGERRSQ